MLGLSKLLIVFVNFFKKNFKKSFQIVDKGVLVTYKYDLYVATPRINENDPYTGIVLYFGSNSFLITLLFFLSFLTLIRNWKNFQADEFLISE